MLFSLDQKVLRLMSRQYWLTAAEWSLSMSLGQDSSHRSACSTTTHFKLRNIQSRLNAASWFAWLCSLFCRCATSAKKLEFMFICPTATVETQQMFSIEAVYSHHSSVHLHQCWSTVSFTFNLPRECPEDPHIKRFNELHESSTHFCHCSRRRDVYSAAEGKKKQQHLSSNSEQTYKCVLFPVIYASDVPQEKPPENTTTVWVWVRLSSSSSARVPGIEMPEEERSFGSLIAEDTCL